MPASPPSAPAAHEASPLHYSPKALTQLGELESLLIECAGRQVADAYVDHVLDFCDGLAVERGSGITVTTCSRSDT
ncbi:MAG TPA: hypothetical protein VFG72_03555 [Marmoricola sp.]|nr:hypothetical protein [Marmoricola sp.]